MSIEAEREMWDAIAHQARGPVYIGRATRTIQNRRAGDCRLCGGHVAAGDGLAVLYGRTWHVEHEPSRWVGSPVSGRMVGGCPS